MTQYNIYEAKTKLSEIVKTIESRKEECIVLSRNRVPVAKIVPYESNDRSGLFGCGVGLFTVPDDFDDMDITSDFEEGLL